MSEPEAIDTNRRNTTRKAKNWLVEKGLAKDECAVKGCSMGNTEVTTIKPLDPIDHVETVTPLCPDHQVWAAERNDLAKRVTEELREARKEIGQEHLGEIQALAEPDRETSEALLMGEYDTLEEARRAGR